MDQSNGFAAHYGHWGWVAILIMTVSWVLYRFVLARATLAQTAVKDMTEAEVRKVDLDAKKITLKHGPIKNLDMPGMTMVFQVKDAAIWRSVMLLVYLALFSLMAQATAEPIQDRTSIVVVPAVPKADMHSMPVALDCMPCVVCYVGPTPTTANFNAESKEPEEATWRLNTRLTPEESTWRFDTGGRRPRWPVRISFCRWLN